MTVKTTKAGIVIPRELLGGFEEFEEAEVVRGNGKVVVILKVKNAVLRKKIIEKRSAPKRNEQTVLASAQKKIAAINQNLRTAKGLTETETRAAAKAGLIDEEQRWWWTETWQKKEREVENDIANGRVSKPVNSAGELIAHLRGLKP